MSARRRCAAVLVGVAGLLVSSCSNDSTVSIVDDRSPGGTPVGLADLQAAAAGTAELRDVEMTMEMSQDGESVMSLAIVSSGDAARMSVDADEQFLGTTDGTTDDTEVDLGAFPTSGEMIAIGDTVYVRGLFAAGFLMFGDADVDVDAWYEILPSEELEGGFGTEDLTEDFSDDLETSTEEMFDTLDILDGAFGDVTEVGRETIDGVDTTHYSVLVDAEGVEDMLGEFWGEDVDAEVSEDADSDAEAGVIVDLWIDDDGLLRQLVSAEDTSDGRFEFRITIAPADDVRIEAPSDATPFDPATMLDDLFGEFGASLDEGFDQGFEGAIDEFEQFLPGDEELESLADELEQSLAELEDALGADVPGTTPGQ